MHFIAESISRLIYLQHVNLKPCFHLVFFFLAAAADAASFGTAAASNMAWPQLQNYLRSRTEKTGGRRSILKQEMF
jgi:hypothetical protein